VFILRWMSASETVVFLGHVLFLKESPVFRSRLLGWGGYLVRFRALAFRGHDLSLLRKHQAAFLRGLRARAVPAGVSHLSLSFACMPTMSLRKRMKRISHFFDDANVKMNRSNLRRLLQAKQQLKILNVTRK